MTVHDQITADNKMGKKHYLVTGGAGFIGSHLVEALLRDGSKVTVLDNLSTGKKSNLYAVMDRITFIEGDICDPGTVNSAAEGVDVIFHQAAMPSVVESIKDPALTHEVNLTGTVNVLEAARLNKVSKVVYASSAAVYGPARELPQTEETETGPVSPYGLHKLTGEHYCRLYQELYGIQTVCLRYFNVYGHRQDPHSPYSGVISIFSETILNGKSPTVYGDGLQRRDFVHVSDVVQANILAAQTSWFESLILNVASGDSNSLLTLLKILERLTGQNFKIRFKEERRGDLRDSSACIEKTREILGYEPQRSLEDGLKLFLATLQRPEPESLTA